MAIHVEQTLFHGRPENEDGRLEKERRCYDLLDSLGIAYDRADHDHADTIPDCEHGDPTSLVPHERLTDLAVVPREKPHTGAAAREQPRDSPVIER